MKLTIEIELSEHEDAVASELDSTVIFNALEWAIRESSHMDILNDYGLKIDNIKEITSP